jgi:hypothetical protein
MLTLDFSTGSAPSAEGRKLTRTWLDDAGRLCGRGYVNGSDCWIDWEGLGLFHFRSDDPTVSVWPASGLDRSIVSETFSRVLQPVVLQAMGRQALHASAAGGASGVLAFCGQAGSGKSTIARALSQAGLRQFADDAVVLRVDPSRVTVDPVPFTSRLREPSREYFAGAPRGELRPLTSSQALRAVFVLHQNDQLTDSARAGALGGAQAFEALLTHAHCFDDGDSVQTRRLVEDYLVVAERVPVFALEYRPRFAELSKLIDIVLCVARRLDLGARTATPVGVR